MSIDLVRLAANDRAFDSTRAWTAEENEAVYLFIRERNLSREKSANYVRNGVLTLKDLDKALEIGLEPKKLEDVRDIAFAGLKKETKKSISSPKSKKTKVQRKK